MPGSCCSQRARSASASSGSVVTNIAWIIDGSVASERPNITAWTTERLMPLTGITTRCSRWGLSNTRSARTSSSARLGVVLAPDEQHPGDERRDEQQHEPRAVDELHRGDDDRDDARQHAADGVDRQPPSPALRLGPDPVADHARLRDREVDEHAHRVQRDQGVGRGAAGDHDRAGDGAQQDDPGREREPVAAERELARDEAVLGEHRREARERRRTTCSRRGTAAAP